MYFILGKLFYLYKFGYLSVEQIEYFELHKDSLIKIRGNELSPLSIPPLSRPGL